MANNLNIKSPAQKLPFSRKGKKWRKDNVDNADKFSLYHNEGVRQSLKNKIINLNLYNGIVNIKDMTSVVNPYDITAEYIPKNLPHHPIIVPKVDLLVGEEMKRRFDWSVIVSDSDSISKKQEDRKNALKEKIVSFLQNNYEEDELELKMSELEKYMKYDWKDMREKMANQILKHYWEEQRFGNIFSEGFKDVMILAEEIFQVDIIANEPKLVKLNPLKVRTVRSSNSNKIQDSDIIVIEDHWSPSKIVDTFYEELKSKDVDHILEYSSTSGSSSTYSYSDDDNNHVLLRDAEDIGVIDDIIDMAEVNGHSFSSNYMDEDGNVRVLRVYWKSLKQVKKVKYYDELGEVQYKFMSEEYVPVKEMGEESTSLWINEIWEGTKIGKDVYIQMRPKPVQFNRLNNKSECHAGIIGRVFNTNQGKGVSLIDRCKNYQYMYDAIWDRLNKAIATNYGKIFELDISKIPANWEVGKWMHFAVTNKIAVIDSFKEGNHGASTGKLAGSMNTQGGRSIDMETGNYIQQHVQLLEFIKSEMAEISGVSQQRQGQISNRETVGGVERAVNQSSHITEFWFKQHEEVKLEVLSAFLETAKIALKGNNKKVQYILDDNSIEILNMDGDSFCESDYGIVCTDSAKAMEMEQTIKQFSQAFIQNGGNMSTVMDIYFSKSITDMRRKLEIAENELHQRNSEQAQAANKQAQAEAQQAMELEQMKLTLEDTLNQRDNDTKVLIAGMNSQNDDSSDGVIDYGDNNNLDRDKLNLDRTKVNNDLIVKIKNLDNDMKKHYDNLKIKEKQLNKPTTVGK